MLNKVDFQGRLTKDVELKEVGGFKLAEFTVAWSEKYKDIENKCFLRCKAWRGTAELLNTHFKKGQEIVIEGKLQTEEWEKDGQKQSRTICNVDRVHFCGSRVDSSQSTTDDGFVNVPDSIDEEVPFK